MGTAAQMLATGEEPTCEFTDPETSWIATYSNLQFTPFAPKQQDILLVDIAQGLSINARYTGQSRFGYKIGQHCILVSRLIWERLRKEGESPAVARHLALTGLLHDASEAYLSDIASPVKRHLEPYVRLERTLEVAIAKRFGVPFPFPEIVGWADRTAFRMEVPVLLGTQSPLYRRLDQPLPVGIHGKWISPMSEAEVRDAYIFYFQQFGGTG